MSAALRCNVDSRRTALRHLEDGGAIVVFPAGRVSTAPRVFDKAVDAPWKLFCATMILRSRANILPMYFEGANSWRFHLVSLFSEALREALLLGEVSRRIGSELVANIGSIISGSGSVEVIYTASSADETANFIDHINTATDQGTALFELYLSTTGTKLISFDGVVTAAELTATVGEIEIITVNFVTNGSITTSI